MDAAAELGRNPVSTRFSLSMEMSRLTREETAEPVSRDQILRHARGQGNIHFPCSADHEQDWQPYPVDPYSAIRNDHTHIDYINTYNTVVTQCYYHQGTRLNAIKRFRLCAARRPSSLPGSS